MIAYLRPGPGQVIVDATVGLGGHAARIMPPLAPGGLLVGIDKDEGALRQARARLDRAACRLFHADFADLDAVIAEAGVKAIDGALFDLGVSSWQVDTAERGFAYGADGPLDMRMDPSQTLTAADIVNRWPPEELRRIFREYADEKHAGRVARAVAEARAARPLARTAELAAIFRRATAGRQGTRHPEAALFQAVRIAVNGEFESIRTGLRAAMGLLKPGGRMCVIAFHSGEDRIVKNLLRETPGLAAVTRKPVTPSAAEIAANPRSRSAKLRVAERTIDAYAITVEPLFRGAGLRRHGRPVAQPDHRHGQQDRDAPEGALGTPGAERQAQG